jgi:hypothetical protein
MSINHYMNSSFKTYLYCLLGAFFGSCKMHTALLSNNTTRVPVSRDVYKNRVHFDKSLLQILDTGSVYEELELRYNVLSRLDTNKGTSVYGIYKFYPSGNLNYFVIDREEQFTPDIFDPTYAGYRGVYYLKGNRIKGELFGVADERSNIRKLDNEFTFKGDTLFVTTKNRGLSYHSIYIKRKLPREYFVYKADW